MDKSNEEIHREKVKKDKIFNGRYKKGEGYRDKEDYEYGVSIEVDLNYSNNYLKDVYEYEDALYYRIGVSRVFDLFQEEEDLREILKKVNKNEKIKLSKKEINDIFNRMLVKLKKIEDENTFYNPIYILEAISSIVGINSSDPIKDYKKIFDCLDVHIQEELLVELDKKYNFLDGKMNRRKMH